MVATNVLQRPPFLEIVDDTPSSRALKVMDCYLGYYLFFSYRLRLPECMHAPFPALRFAHALVQKDSQKATSAVLDRCSSEDSLAS